MNIIKEGGKNIRIECGVYPRDCEYHPDESSKCLATLEQMKIKGCFRSFMEIWDK